MHKEMHVHTGTHMQWTHSTHVHTYAHVNVILRGPPVPGLDVGVTEEPLQLPQGMDREAPGHGTGPQLGSASGFRFYSWAGLFPRTGAGWPDPCPTRVSLGCGPSPASQLPALATWPHWRTLQGAEGRRSEGYKNGVLPGLEAGSESWWLGWKGWKIGVVGAEVWGDGG